jgi:hypothetical protein
MVFSEAKGPWQTKMDITAKISVVTLVIGWCGLANAQQRPCP